MYKAYRAALDQTQGANAIDSSFYSADLELYWFFRAVDRALQGKDLDRELADAQLLTEQFAACVKDSGNDSACAKQVDPQYEGWRSTEP